MVIRLTGNRKQEMTRRNRERTRGQNWHRRTPQLARATEKHYLFDLDAFRSPGAPRACYLEIERFESSRLTKCHILQKSPCRFQRPIRGLSVRRSVAPRAGMLRACCWP